MKIEFIDLRSRYKIERQEILKTLDETNVDLIEIGMPFSDPIADGPIIQNSSNVAINNGMNLNILFDQLLGEQKDK